MTRITLPPDLEEPLAKEARRLGTTPELLALDSLRTLFVAKVFDEDFRNPPVSVFKSDAMKALARELALNSIVLLKNEGHVLPFDRRQVKKVAVIGPHANYGKHFNEGIYDYTLFQVGGSANVKPDPEDMITPLEGIRELLGDAVEVVYTPGVYAENGCGPIASLRRSCSAAC